MEIISIVIAIALATGFSTLSEYRNTSRSEALQEEYSKTYAKVVRDGKLVNILTSEIVKGDTILIQAGDKVPADGLLFEGKIKVSQAALNGESRDENKAAVTNMDEAESTDYSSHGKVFMGSVVTSGEGYLRSLQLTHPVYRYLLPHPPASGWKYLFALLPRRYLSELCLSFLIQNCLR